MVKRTDRWWPEWAAALTVALMAYGAAYGLSIQTSIDSWSTVPGGRIEASSDLGGEVTWFLVTLVACVAAVAMVRGRMLRWPWSQERTPWSLTLAVAGMAMSLTMLGIVIKHMLGNNTGMTGGGITPVEIALTVVRAGVGEEILVLAVPVFLMKSIGVRFAVALPILVVLRVAYHLYYQWETVFLVPWAIGLAVIYWRWPTGRVLLGLIGAHILYDTLAFVQPFGHPYVVMVGCTVVLLGAGCVVGRWWRTPSVPVPLFPDRGIVRRRGGRRVAGDGGVVVGAT
ncbi:hypothetical protein [Gordonia malaquae]|uniref:hypothetical protein n=1 Tax=Gordonia malaquae TaxID=410332 RepID=UPI0030171E54